MVLACLPAISWADDDKYLEGAVPEVDGKVVFSKEVDMQGIDQDAIYEYMYAWLDKRMKANNNVSRIVLAEKEKGQIVAVVEEYLVFTDNALSRDRAIMNYNIIISCSSGKYKLQIDRIRYNYEKDKYTAEEMIVDKVALNKDKTAIFAGYKKFRINTIDFVNDMFEAIRTQAILNFSKLGG